MLPNELNDGAIETITFQKPDRSVSDLKYLREARERNSLTPHLRPKRNTNIPEQLSRASSKCYPFSSAPLLRLPTAFSDDVIGHTTLVERFRLPLNSLALAVRLVWSYRFAMTASLQCRSPNGFISFQVPRLSVKCSLVGIARCTSMSLPVPPFLCDPVDSPSGSSQCCLHRVALATYTHHPDALMPRRVLRL